MNVFLFDFDGVIVDSLQIAVKVYNVLFAKYELDIELTRDEFAALFLGNFHRGLEELVPNREIREQILIDKVAEYTRLVDEYVVFEGMREVMRTFSSMGRVLIISSNASDFILKLLEVQHIGGVDEVLGSDVETSKITKIGWQKEAFPESAIYYIGDTSGDVLEGKEAGVQTIGVSWGFHERRLLEEAGADYVVDTPADLLELGKRLAMT